MNTYPIPEQWLHRPVQIDLVGVGGTGSQVADQLASLQTTLMQLGHPGFRVNLWDADRVSASNVGRQRFTRSDVGLNKSIILCHRINQFYGLDWTSQPKAYAPRQHASGNLLITCVDKALLRAQIGQTVCGDGFWLDFGNGATTGQVVFGRLKNTTYSKREPWDVLPNVYDLYPDLAHMGAVDREQPSCSAEEAIQRQAWPTNRLVAIAGTELLWNFFRHGHITHHGAFVSGNPLTVTPLAIDPNAWAFMGYALPDYARPKTAATAKRTARKRAA